MDVATSTEGRVVGLPKNLKVMSGRQAKAARAVLDYSVATLAAKSKISESSIRRIEEGRDATVKVDLVLRLQAYFEGKSFTFLWEQDECGVKWAGDC